MKFHLRNIKEKSTSLMRLAMNQMIWFPAIKELTSLINLIERKWGHKQPKLNIVPQSSNCRLKPNIKQDIVLKDWKHSRKVIHPPKKENISQILINLKELPHTKTSTSPKKTKAHLLPKKRVNTLPANFRYRLRLHTKIFINLIKYSLALSDRTPKIT